MRIAVLIVNWNSGGMLDRCLDSLHRQIRPADRIIVIDNASQDGSLARVGHAYPAVEVVRLRANAGFAEASNEAARAASDCDWLATLNPDAFPEPGWLAELARAAEGRHEFASFASQLRMASDPDRLDGIGDAYHVSGLAWRMRHRLPRTAASDEAREVFSPCAAAALYRRDAFWEAGGFDDAYFCYAEDVDLGFRLRLKGYRCLYVPQAIALHEGSAMSGRHSGFAVYHGHRNLVWTYVKDMPGLMFWLYLPQHLLLNLVTLCWFSLRGQGAVIFRAKRDAVYGLPRAWRARRETQRTRRVAAGDLRRAMTTGLLTPYLWQMKWRAVRERVS